MMEKNRSSPRWQEDKNERFVNPYNFVPLEDCCGRSSIGVMPDGLTGYLDCCLDVLTPLFIPNTSNDKALHTPAASSKNTHSYDFFSYTNLLGKSPEEIRKNPRLPVIPGSEIRGAVRSVFEAAFHGCMSSVYLERPLGHRSAVPKKAGILQKNGEDEWEIIPCRRWMLNTTYKNEKQRLGEYVDPVLYKRWREGQKLYVKRKETPYIKNGRHTEYFIVDDIKENVDCSEGWEQGYLHKGEKFGGKKHNESVFVIEEQSKKITVSKEDVEKLREVICQYRDSNINVQLRKENKEWYKEYKIKEEVTPVYYYDNPDKKIPVYMAPACISKEVFHQSIKKLLLEQGEYQPCERRDHLCQACALFGMVTREAKGGKNAEGGARASRVRFEDAALINPPDQKRMEECYWPEMTLPEMGEPKPSAVEFYTLPPSEKQPGDSSYGYWTYDYKMVGNSRKLLQENQPKLRGRKFYWHSDAWENHINCNEEPTEMRQRIRPLRTERGEGKPEPMVFRFRVYFENITEEELIQLRWSLTFDDSKCAHKIGRAKPLGFGSVRISVKQVCIRQIDQETGEWSCPPQSQFLENSPVNLTDTMKILKMMMNWEKRPKADVCYPEVQATAQSGSNKKGNDTASHQWFTGNRDMATDAGSMRPTFAKVLPKPEEEMAAQEPLGKWLYKLKKRELRE